MTNSSKVFTISFLVLCASLLVTGFKAIARHQEVNRFFRETDDLEWAQQYLDKIVNFCDAPWEHSQELIDSKSHIFKSPSGNLHIRKYVKASFEESFELLESQSKSLLLDFTFSWDPKGASISINDFKWAKAERFLIFRKPITMDNDWGTSKIYIYNITSGDLIYLGDSEFYDCTTRTW